MMRLAGWGLVMVALTSGCGEAASTSVDGAGDGAAATDTVGDGDTGSPDAGETDTPSAGDTGDDADAGTDSATADTGPTDASETEMGDDADTTAGDADGSADTPGDGAVGDTTDVTACDAGQWASPDGCVAWTECTPDQYEFAAPSATSDRECTDLTVCTGEQYESAAPTATTDRECTDLTVCTDEQYESVAPTATTDRECTDLTVCSDEQYESVAPTATTDRECTDLTVCTADEYESTPPTPTTDRVCSPLTVCTLGQEVDEPATATTDRTCRDCGPGEYCAGGTTPSDNCGWDDRDLDPTTPCNKIEKVVTAGRCVATLNSEGEVYVYGFPCRDFGIDPSEEFAQSPLQPWPYQEIVDIVGDGLTSESSGVVMGLAADGSIVDFNVPSDTIAPPANLASFGDAGTRCGFDANGLVTCNMSCGGWTPFSVPTGGSLAGLYSGGGFACTLDDQGVVSCGGCSGTPTWLQDPGTVAAMDVSASGACFIKEADQDVVCLDTQGGLNWFASWAKTEAIQAQQVCAGEEHACALTTTGEVTCWGITAGSPSHPYEVPTFPGYAAPVEDLVCGGSKTCQLDADGNLFCYGGWGYDDSAWRTNVGYRPKVQLASGYGFVAALDELGFVNIFGDGVQYDTKGYVQALWDESLDIAEVLVAPNVGALCIKDSTGYYSCPGGDAATWGLEGVFDDFQVGDGFLCGLLDGQVTCSGNIPPVPDDLGNVIDIAGSFGSLCTLDDASVVRCWGQYGIDDTYTTTITHTFAPGDGTVCGLTDTDEVECHGLQNGTVPMPSDLGPVTHLAAGNSGFCAIDMDKMIHCWGSGPVTEYAPDFPMPGEPVQLVADQQHACVLDDAGRVGCWGDLGQGYAGDAYYIDGPNFP